MKAAIRWRIKDLLDYHVDDATVDVLDIPPDPAGATRSHSMYAVAARNEAVQACIERFDAAQIPLSVIDIAETAQRNIAALYEEEGRGVGLLHLGEGDGLFTINFRRELYLARRIDIGYAQISAVHERAEAFNRIALELTRTLDHFDRQFGFVAVNKLLLGPEPEDSGLLEHLKSNLAIPISRVDLGATLAFDSEARLDPRTEWQRFHLIGASLRYETKAALRGRGEPADQPLQSDLSQAGEVFLRHDNGRVAGPDPGRAVRLLRLRVQRGEIVRRRGGGRRRTSWPMRAIASSA